MNKLTVMNKITAPFTPEQVKNLRAWQESDYVHPFTCCNHQTMTVEMDGFHCPKCGTVQTWCHDFMASGRLPRQFKLPDIKMTHDHEPNQT